MTPLKAKEFLSTLTGQITFEFNGFPCGIDPIALDQFNMWYGDNDMTAKSIEEVFNAKFFDGMSLEDIWDDITELDY